MISLSEVGWAAGLYEGECSFIANKDGKGQHVSMTQKDPWPLVKLQTLFGGEVHPYSGYNYWRLYGAECRAFVLTIFTFLSPRRRQQILKHVEFFTIPDCCPNGHTYKEGSYKIVTVSGRSYKQCLACRVMNRAKHGHGLKSAYTDLFNAGLENLKKDGFVQ